MGFLSKLFGYCGKVRFEGMTLDGKEFSGSVEIETFNMDNKAVEEKLKNICFVEYGWKVKELRIVAAT